MVALNLSKRLKSFVLKCTDTHCMGMQAGYDGPAVYAATCLHQSQAAIPGTSLTSATHHSRRSFILENKMFALAVNPLLTLDSQLIAIVAKRPQPHYVLVKVYTSDASLVSCQAPSEVLLEPKELSAGTTFSLSAGAAIPETSARVTNGLGQPLVKALLGGQKIPLMLVQRLWRVKDNQGELHCVQTDGRMITICR